MAKANLTIQEIGELLTGEVSAELLAELRQDKRVSVTKLLRRYDREQAERARLDKLFFFEHEAQKNGCNFVAGVDEAGRGPLAGPVVVAAVILPIDLYLPKLNDSKKLSPKVRDDLYEQIKEKAISLSCSIIEPEIIDRDNIYRATIQGMYDSIASLEPAPDKVLIDAVPLDKLTIPSLSIVKGDAKSASIAAASIIAKVTRDRIMLQLDKKYPQYGFAQHKGYGTSQHIDALKKYGPCPIHRRSFAPISEMVGFVKQ